MTLVGVFGGVCLNFVFYLSESLTTQENTKNFEHFTKTVHNHVRGIRASVPARNYNVLWKVLMEIC